MRVSLYIRAKTLHNYCHNWIVCLSVAGILYMVRAVEVEGCGPLSKVRLHHFSGPIPALISGRSSSGCFQTCSFEHTGNKCLVANLKFGLMYRSHVVEK